MAYSTPAPSLTFSTFVASSQGHLVSSLSQLQSTLAAKRKGNTRPQKDNTAKKGGASQIPLMMLNTMLQRRGGTRLIPGMAPNRMAKSMFFLSQMHLLERSSGRRGGELCLIQPQLLRHINLNSCRGLFQPNQPMMGRKRPRVHCCIYYSMHAAE
jgi:hypothetical protein